MLEIDVTDNPKLLNSTVNDARAFSGAQFLAIRRANDELVISPGDNRVFQQGDRLVVICTQDQMALLRGVN